MNEEVPHAASGPEELRARTKAFALRIIGLFRALPGSEEARVIGRQSLRAGTSVAANNRALCRARSKAEFIAKMGVVIEEADEAVFWLELLVDAGIVPQERMGHVLAEANELVAIFVASRRTARGDGRHSLNH
jgi:four helix bundle protein